MKKTIIFTTYLVYCMLFSSITFAQHTVFPIIPINSVTNPPSSLMEQQRITFENTSFSDRGQSTLRNTTYPTIQSTITEPTITNSVTGKQQLAIKVKMVDDNDATTTFEIPLSITKSNTINWWLFLPLCGCFGMLYWFWKQNRTLAKMVSHLQTTTIPTQQETTLPTKALKESDTPIKTTTTELPTIPDELQEWLQTLDNKILENIENPKYTIDQLSLDMGLGKRQIARRVKEAVGVTPSIYIKSMRFNKAHELLEQRTYPTVKAVVYSIGMKDPVYFAREFKKRFGKLPSVYLE